MDWVRDFYAKQNDWGDGIYERAVGEDDRQRAARVEAWAGPGPLRVLELGAGGGQTSAALADLGHDVTAVDIQPVALEFARSLADQPRPGTMSVIAGDFYEIELAGAFDVVCYWDGFGIGTDDDQRRLLTRIGQWLEPAGSAVIEVGTPWYWASAAGEGWQVGRAMRRYSFDHDECRMLDTWWPVGDESQTVTQSIRCYSPADLRLLLRGTGLLLETLEPTGAMDYRAGTYRSQAPLEEAMGYMARLERVDS